MTKKKSPGYISISDNEYHEFYIKSEFKGMVNDKPVRTPKSLGAEHPFNFKDTELLWRRCGLVNESISKFANSIVTDFQIVLDNENSQALVDSFIHDTNLQVVLTSWVSEALLKGNGFIEIDLKESKLRVMNANHMFIKRDKKGKVLKYNQWTKPLQKFDRTSPELIPFEVDQIAHLPINKVANDPYGIGIVYPNERIIENLIKNENDLQVIVSRKAGAPYHFKVGQPGSNIPSTVIDQIKGKLQFLTRSHEWVTDGDIEIKAIDFKDLGKSLTQAQDYFKQQYIAGIGIPEVLFGSGQLNEGIAKVQLQSYKQKIKSYQNLISDIIEEKIIRPLLKANGLDEQPTFIWDLPTEEEIDKKLKLLKEMKNANVIIHPALGAGIDIEIAKLLEMDEIIPFLTPPEKAEELKKEQEEIEREEEAEIPQPEVPGAKATANESIVEIVKKEGDKWCVRSERTGKNLGCFKTKAEAEKRLAQLKRHKSINENTNDLTVKEFVDLKELAGFNYTQFLVKILEVLKTDNFTELKALDDQDLLNGLLSKSEIEKLREVLKSGFKKNQTITQIEKEINDNIDLRDRVTKNGGVIAATFRPNSIARTETVRVANEGLIKLYRENKILNVRFLAALSDRTCPICEDLNGQVFKINESSGVIPVHTNCRCTWVSIVV